MKIKVNQIKAGIILAYATQALQIIIGLLYTPVMLRILGKNEYGLYQLVNSTVSYLGLVSLGFGNSYMRFFARYNAKNDEDGIKKLNGLFFIIFAVIAFICLLCGVFMVTNASFIFGNKYSGAELTKIKILTAILVLNLVIFFLGTVYQSNINANEKFFFQRLVVFLQALFNPFLALPLLLLGYGSVGMVSVTTFLTLLSFVLNIYYSKKKLKIKFDFKKPDFSLFREMWTFTIFIFINMVVDQLNWSVDKFLLGRMEGTESVAVYSIASQLNTMFMNFCMVISAMFIPRVNNIVTKNNDNKEINLLFARVSRIQYLFICLVISGLVLFGREFIFYWAGKSYTCSYEIALFLMIPVSIPMLQVLGIEIQRAMNMHKARSYVYLAIAIGNVCLSIPCIIRFGAVGAAFATAITMLLGNGLFMNWYYGKKMRLDIKGFWFQIIKFVPITLIIVLLGYIEKMFIYADSLFSLVLSILVYSLIYIILMWLFGMNKEEKEHILVYFKRLKKSK